MANMIDADKLVEWLNVMQDEVAKASDYEWESGDRRKSLALFAREETLRIVTHEVKELFLEFEDDGWCYDISKAPRDKEIIVSDGVEVFTARYKESNNQSYFPFFAKCCNGDFLNEGHDWEEIFVYIYEPIAWRPLPTIPEVRK